MCGFVGIVAVKPQGGGDDLRSAIVKMNQPLVHRGPDDSGIWVDPDAGVALGHRRLSIVDLSPQGHQPMASACGRYLMAYNGEIYNFPALRKELEDADAAPPWRGRSDTEVALAAFAHWGVRDAVLKFEGMFAFALWDRSEQTLYLVRDRLGEKPLYYGWTGGSFLFGSDLLGLGAHPHWEGAIDHEALDLYLRYNYVPAPLSIYRGVFKLSPGTLVRVRRKDLEPPLERSPLEEIPYWSALEVAERGLATPFAGSEHEAVSRLDALLGRSVAQQMVADVPLGAFLSGGIDSSTVAAVMQAQSARPIKTFTIGFDDPRFNEAPYAKAIAHHLGTDHTELHVSAQDALAVIPQIPTLFSEPFADASQIPTFLVSQLTRKHVTVSLSGDGGDELFAGYNRYFLVRDIWKKLGWLPAPVRRSAARLLNALPDKPLELGFSWLRPVTEKYGRGGLISDKVRKLSLVLEADSMESLNRKLVSEWDGFSPLLQRGAAGESPFEQKGRLAHLPDDLEKMMYLDSVSYLPDDILVKLDRAAMGVSLETRVPMLDHQVVEFSWQLPRHLKIRDGKGKYILRQVLFGYVPEHLIENRPKRGFGVPVGEWVRGPLREWAEDLLSAERLARQQLFSPAPIREKWEEHLSGRRDWSSLIWNILMIQAWLDQYGRAGAGISKGSLWARQGRG